MNYSKMKKAELIEELGELQKQVEGLHGVTTQLKEMGQATQKSCMLAESIVGTVRTAIVLLDENLRVIFANRFFFETFEVMHEESQGKLLYDLGNKQWNIPKLRTLLERILPESTSVDDYEVEHNFETIGRRTMLLNARRLHVEMGGIQLILLAIEDITKRKQVQEKLRKHRERLEALMEDCTIALQERAKETDCLYEISRLVSAADRTIEEVLRESVVLIPPGFKYPEIACARITFDSREFLSAGFMETEWKLSADIIVSGKTVGAVEVFLTEEKPAFEKGLFFEEEKDLIDDLAKQLGLMIAHKQAEKALRESELKFRSVVENAPNIIMIVDREGTIQFINRTVPGVTVEEIIGKNHFDYIGPEYHGMVKKAIEHVFLTGEHGSYEIQGAGPNGRTSWYKTQIGLLRNNGSTDIVILITTDISEQKEAEEALLESENKYKILFEGVAGGILVADVETRKFKYANTAICRMLGYTEEEINGLGVEDIHPKESLDKVFAEFEAQRRGEKLLAPSLPCLRKDGTIFYADITTAPILLKGRLCNVGFFNDITEKIEMEKAQRKLDTQQLVVEELKRIDQLKDEFISVVAHELRTPMTPLKSSVEMMLDGSLGELTPRQIDFVQMMARNIDRLASFTTEILSLSRLEAGRYAINPGIIAIRTTLEPVIDLLQSKAQLKASSLSLDIDLGLTAFADADALAQVLTNLVNNALVHTGEGTVITISCKKLDDKFLEISVVDNGPGIPEEALPYLFDKFYQSQRQSGPGYQGTGIGLALCKKLVEAMGGSIGVESKVGEGTTFRFTLPAMST